MLKYLKTCGCAAVAAAMFTTWPAQADQYTMTLKAAASAFAPALAPGAVAEFTFAADAATDDLANTNNTVTTSSPTYASGGYLVVNDGQWVLSNANVDFSSDSYTVEMWHNSLTGNRVVFGGDVGGLRLSRSSGWFQMYLRDATETLLIDNKGGSHSDNRWYHIALVWDNSGATPEFRSYLDGQPWLSASAPSGFKSTPLSLDLVRSGFSSQQYIDDLIVTRGVKYDAAFTPAPRS